MDSLSVLGLLDMFNAGGAVEECAVDGGGLGRALALRVRGCGHFRAYCSLEPARCLLDSAEVECYDEDTGLVPIDLPVPEQDWRSYTGGRRRLWSKVVSRDACSPAPVLEPELYR